MKDPAIIKDSTTAASEEVKVVPVAATNAKGAKIIPVTSTGNSVLVTGATHARELLSA